MKDWPKINEMETESEGDGRESVKKNEMVDPKVGKNWRSWRMGEEDRDGGVVHKQEH